MRDVVRVLILDRLDLTGEALVGLFDWHCRRACSRHFTGVRRLREALLGGGRRGEGLTLVVMELATDEDSLADCLRLLEELSAVGDWLRVLVYTGVTEPLVLSGLRAGRVVLRREPLSALLQAAHELLSAGPVGERMSAGAGARVREAALPPLTAREMECLVRLAGAPRRGYRSLSREMGCAYKTACAHRRTLAQKLGLASVYGLRGRLLGLQHALGHW